MSSFFFMLQENIPVSNFNRRRELILQRCVIVRQRYLADLASWAATADYLGSAVEYPALCGVQTNLYTNFMAKVWRNSSQNGFSGLIHPEGHFVDPNGGTIRSHTYSRLRRHYQFVVTSFCCSRISAIQRPTVFMYMVRKLR